jgi:hypothetical protein
MKQKEKKLRQMEIYKNSLDVIPLIKSDPNNE